jgi:hypothetical protein
MSDGTYPLHVSAVHALSMAMRQFGIAGRIVPSDPQDTAGTWFVADEDGQDVTGRVLARVAAARARRPERGFVVAR